MGGPVCGRAQVVDGAAGVGNERVFTGQSFFYPSSWPAGPRQRAPGGGAVGWRLARVPARRQIRLAAGPASRWSALIACPGRARCAPGPGPGGGRLERGQAKGGGQHVKGRARFQVIQDEQPPLFRASQPAFCARHQPGVGVVAPPEKRASASARQSRANGSAKAQKVANPNPVSARICRPSVIVFTSGIPKNTIWEQV